MTVKKDCQKRLSKKTVKKDCQKNSKCQKKKKKCTKQLKKKTVFFGADLEDNFFGLK
jgi:NAD-dependent SIR2 family protein deacetylase